MNLGTHRARLLASSMITGFALLIGSTAFAADEAPQELIVTGTRIPQANLTSVSPLSVVTSNELKLQGTVSVESMLQNLPSVLPEYNQGVDNGASGTATVSLRGLGSKRTLVLVNGSRLMPGDPITPSPDVNNIPAALVDRVEVITGGASAVYGSDAVAGVVNFIMKKDFEGVRVDAQFGFATHENGSVADRQTVQNFNALGVINPIALPMNQTDAQTYTATVVVGTNSPDHKGNITAYVGYRDIEPLAQSRRDYGACGISSVQSTTNTYDTHVCQGSSNSAFGRFFLGPGTASYANDPANKAGFVPYSRSKFAFNFGPYNYYQQHDELYTAGFFAHYEIKPAFEVYSSLMFADDNQLSQAAPSGLFSNSGPVYAINCANPFLTGNQQATICGPNAPDQSSIVTRGISDQLKIAYRFAGVPRTTDLKHTAYTVNTGLRGDIGQGWRYDADFQYGKTSFTEVFTGDYSIAKIQDALLAVQGPNGPTCLSGHSGCIPLNIFMPLSQGLTPAQIGYVTEPALKSGSTTEQVATLSVTGDLGRYGIKSPLSKDGVGVAFGGEYRRETLGLSVDNAFASGDLSGAGGVNPPASGAFNVREAFGEMRIPIAEDLPFVKRLSAELGYRFSHYGYASNSVDTHAYKFAGDWQITEDIRLRGGYNRAVRSPNIVELYTPQVVGNASFNDPCAGSAPSQTLAQCEQQGVSPPGTVNAPRGVYGQITPCPAAQCSSLTGGNQLLKPEEADTYTVGLVLQPHFIPGLNFTIDYFDIRINKPITTYTGGVILSQCASGNQFFCGLIHRSPGANGGDLFGITLNDGYVIDTYVNSGSIKTSGIDFGASYRIHLSDLNLGDHGTVDLNFLGTYTDKYTTEPIAGKGTYDCSGFFGPVCGQPQSKFKSETRMTWNTPWNLAVSVNWRYLSSVSLDLNTSNPFMAQNGVGFVDTIDAKIRSYSYFDLAGTYRLKDRYTFRFGINNIFDVDPPVLDANNLGVAGTSSFGNGNTYPGVYDAVGRNVFIGVTADF